jgi:RNA polymerase sigma-70 factor (ECF subfamily)
MTGHPPPDVISLADPTSDGDARGPGRDAERTQALAQTYRDHVRFVWRVAASFGVGPSDREDFVHDVFVVAQRRADDRRADVAMTTWLFGIARYVHLNRARASARHERRLRLVESAPVSDSPDELAERAESLAIVREFIAGLDEPQRIAFELVEIEGMRAAEIAEMTGDNVNTIYTRLRGARQRFRDFVAARTRR